MHSPACTTDWPAGRKCHCAGCCHSFSTVGNFDKHRRAGACVPPADAGLVQNKRGLWTAPGETDYDDRFNRT